MALTNGRGSGQIAILGPRSGCSAAWIGILSILRRLDRHPEHSPAACFMARSHHHHHVAHAQRCYEADEGRLILSALSFVPS